jgi:DNA-binding winged helix-turn-helix (wHTH) protein/Tfp pilus assembly protein PilF
VDTAPQEQPVRIGGWTADRLSGELSNAGRTRSVEPKVMDLLFLLASRPGEVFSKEEIGRALWPDVTVGEDSLSRCVFKLRKALDDDPKAPRFIETIPKRGYRLLSSNPQATARRGHSRRWVAAIFAGGGLAVPAGVYLWNARTVKAGLPQAVAMTARADDLYFQINREDNDAAIALYEQVLQARPDHAAAQAGLANALVQKVIRWSGAPGQDVGPTDLGRALGSGVTRTPRARQLLGRASRLAEGAVRRDPRSAAAWKALGFVRSAQGDFAAAHKAHETAARLDPDAWDALINLADLSRLQGHDQAYLAYLERAYGAMARDYGRRPARVRPWYAETGTLVGRTQEDAGDLDKAEAWYRRVLDHSPLHPQAATGLARVLAARGDRAGAERLCRDLTARSGANAECEAMLARR